MARSERQQHARFEAVHVLRGDRSEQRPAGSVQLQPPRLLAYTGDETPEGLWVRKRGAGGPGGEDVGHELRCVHVRHRAPRHGGPRVCARAALIARISHAGHTVTRLGLIAQRHHIRCEDAELAQHLRRLTGWQETDPSGDEGRGEADGEMVAVRARIQDMRAWWKRASKMVYVAQELRRENG